MYQKFIAANLWTQADYPNIDLHPENVKIKPFQLIKTFIEYFLNNFIGDWLDQKCFSVITRFWRKKFNDLDDNRFSLSLRSQKNVSKHHPNDFQEIVLKKYAENLLLFEQVTGFHLSHTAKKVVVTS
jgi:hypothetical protein